MTKIECETASLNAIPDSCTIFLDRRLTAGETRESAAQGGGVTRLSDGAPVEVLDYARPAYTGLTLETEKYYPTWVLDPGHPLVTAAWRPERPRSGNTPTWTSGRSRRMASSSAGGLGIPTIGFGPSEERWAHSVLDQCPVDHLVASIAYYAALPAALAGIGMRGNDERIELTVNGEEVAVEAAEDETLLDVLRDDWACSRRQGRLPAGGLLRGLHRARRWKRAGRLLDRRPRSSPASPS